MILDENQKANARAEMQKIAEGVFNPLDIGFRPNILLVHVSSIPSGYIETHTGKESPAVLHIIQDEDSSQPYNVSDFEDVEKLSQTIDIQKYLQTTFKKILSRQGRKVKLFYSNLLILNNGHDVYSIVLEIDSHCLDKYYFLSSIKRITYPNNTIKSFVYTLIEELLQECKIYIEKRINRIYDRISSQNIINTSGDSFMRKLAFLATENQVNGYEIEAILNFYEACNKISSLRYEGEEGVGKVLLAREGHPNVRFTFRLKEYIKLSDFRKVRKFLELSEGDSLVITDGNSIKGLGEIAGKYNPNDEDLFIIDFVSHHTWCILHDGNPLMVVEYNKPMLPKLKMDMQIFFEHLKYTFSNFITSDEYPDYFYKLWDIVMKCTEQRHGTMLVISDNAGSEVGRLKNQSFGLSPFLLDVNTVPKITSIDGAVFIDLDCICYGIGVILDGTSDPKKGDSSRGARYNSAVRYCETYKKEFAIMIVIVSEDGMVNIISSIDI